MQQTRTMLFICKMHLVVDNADKTLAVFFFAFVIFCFPERTFRYSCIDTRFFISQTSVLSCITDQKTRHSRSFPLSEHRLLPTPDYFTSTTLTDASFTPRIPPHQRRITKQGALPKMPRLGRRGIILSLFINSLNITLYLLILVAACLNIIEASVNFIILNAFAA